MAVGRTPEQRDAPRARALRAVKVIQVVAIIVALAALGVFLFKIGVDPALAGKKIGH